MICHDVIVNIPRFLEDSLSEHENLLFQQHIQQCERCRLVCFNARKKSESQEWWLRITAGLNVLIVISAIVYFMFGPLIKAKVQSFLTSLRGTAASSQPSGSQLAQNSSAPKTVPFIQLKPLHWDLYFPDRSKLESLSSRLRSKGIKVLYEDSGLIILTIDREAVNYLINILSESGGVFQGGGSLYSFKLPDFEGDFRLSINLKFPQSRVSQPLAHHWHLNFRLPNRFMAKDYIRETGARFLFEIPEIWVIQIPGRDFDKLKDVLRSTHGVEVDFGVETVSAESYGKIPVTISLYIAEG